MDENKPKEAGIRPFQNSFVKDKRKKDRTGRHSKIFTLTGGRLKRKDEINVRSKVEVLYYFDLFPL